MVNRFLAIPVLSALLALMFFAWGLSTPSLDRVWRMHADLRIGARPLLTERERSIWRETLLVHPELGRIAEDQHAGIISQHERGSVSIDYAYVLRTKASQQRIRITHAYPARKTRIKVSGDIAGTIEPGEALVKELPPFAGPPELIELSFAPTRTVRIDWMKP